MYYLVLHILSVSHAFVTSFCECCSFWRTPLLSWFIFIFSVASLISLAWFGSPDEVTKRFRLGCGKGYSYHSGLSHTDKIFDYTVVSKPFRVLSSLVIIKILMNAWSFWNLLKLLSGLATRLFDQPKRKFRHLYPHDRFSLLVGRSCW